MKDLEMHWKSYMRTAIVNTIIWFAIPCLLVISGDLNPLEGFLITVGIGSIMSVLCVEHNLNEEWKRWER